MKTRYNNIILAWLILLSFNVSGLNAQSKTSPFFSEPYMTSAVVNLSGTSVASIVNSEDGQELIISYADNRPKKKLLNLSEFTPENAFIGRLVWLDDKTLSAQFVEIKKGVEGLVDTKAVNFLLVIQIPQNNSDKPVIKSVRTKGQLVNPLNGEEDAFLYAKNGFHSKVYKIKPSLLAPHKKRLSKLNKKDGGQFKKKNEVVSIKGYAVRWFFNPKGDARAVLSINEEGELTLNTLNGDDEFVELKSWDLGRWKKTDKFKRLIPIALAKEKNTFYCLDYNEQEVRSVYKVNFDDDSESLIYESSEYEIVRLITSEHSGEVVGVKVMKNGELINHYTNTFSAGEDRPQRMGALYSIISESADGRVSVAYAESYNRPGRFILQKKSRQSKTIIGKVFPKIPAELKTKQLEGQVLVDGIEIPYLLNIPSASKAGKFPLIVHPHGGPIGPFNSKYFDSTIQYLNAEGFAVLRVNFRGSGGHSIELKKAGSKQWGHSMLEDIRQSTKAVVKRNDIDREKVCIFGMSYGGYAATMLSITDPNLFQCGVSIAGVSDVNLYLNSPYLSDEQADWVREHVGDSETEYDSIKSISPVYQIEKLTRPILIMHGAKDRVVDVEHLYRLKLMLEKHGKKFEWKVFDNLAHSLGSPEQSQQVFEQSIGFIREQLRLN